MNAVAHPSNGRRMVLAALAAFVIIAGLLALLMLAYLVGATHNNRLTNQVWVGCCACAADRGAMVAPIVGRTDAPDREMTRPPAMAMHRRPVPPAYIQRAAPAIADDLAEALQPAWEIAPLEAFGPIGPMPFAPTIACTRRCGASVAVPEPKNAYWMLIGVAATGLAVRRRRRARATAHPGEETR